MVADYKGIYKTREELRVALVKGEATLGDAILFTIDSGESLILDSTETYQIVARYSDSIEPEIRAIRDRNMAARARFRDFILR